MKSLGIELKGNTCIGVLVSGVSSVDNTLKIEIADSYDHKDIESFSSQFEEFLNESQAERIVIKKRQEKGKFAGGALSFKMEGLIQLIAKEKTCFVSGAQLNAFAKKNSETPDVKKYQSQALFCAMYGLDI